GLRRMCVLAVALGGHVAGTVGDEIGILERTFGVDQFLDQPDAFLWPKIFIQAGDAGVCNLTPGNCHRVFLLSFASHTQKSRCKHAPGERRTPAPPCRLHRWPLRPMHVPLTALRLLSDSCAATIRSNLSVDVASTGGKQ